MTQKPTRAEQRAATAARILDAARAEFGERGERASIRGIATRAGVDPSLVLQHYGSKRALFSLAVAPAVHLEPADVSEHLADVVRGRVTDLPPETRALMRSMLTSSEAATVMRDYLQERVDVLAKALPVPDAELHAAVAASAILGVTIARHFLELPALVDADPERLADLVRQWPGAASVRADDIAPSGVAPTGAKTPR